MNIFKKILEKLKNIFIKREEPLMIEEGNEHINNNERNNFKESLKVKIEKIYKNKRVESHICYGDGLGIKKKMEY